MFYLFKLVLPISLGIDYGRSSHFVFQHTQNSLLWIVPYVLLIIIWIFKKRKPWLMTSAGLFVACILPVSGLIPFSFQNFSTVADLYLYFAMLGPSVAVAWILSRNWKKPVIITYVLVLIPLGVLCSKQTMHWKNNTLLYGHALKVNPNSWISHNNLGSVFEAEGNFEEAAKHYTLALKAKPFYAHANYNLGLVLGKQGKYEEALVHFSEALRLKPDWSKTHNNMGLVLEKQGELGEAIEHYMEAIRLEPDNANAHYNLGVALEKQGKLKDASFHFSEAIRLKPEFAYNLDISRGEKDARHVIGYPDRLSREKENAEEYFRQGVSFENQGNIEKAADYYRKALESNPDLAKTHYNLGTVWFRQGKKEKAIGHYHESIRIEPDYAKAHNNLGFVLETQGKFGEAIEHYSMALWIDPNYDDAKNNLSRARQKQKQ